MIWQRLRAWAKGMKGDILALWIAARDSRTPALAKLVAAIIAAYALSPIDLIPDFIPVVGYLDDLLIVPFGIFLAVRLIPRLLMEEYRVEARPSSRAGAALVFILWLTSAGAVWLWLD
jgi:uncharacterized membrane protein YkvA (DUF1232 family)